MSLTCLSLVKSFRHLVAAYRTFAEQLEERAGLDGSEETMQSAVEYYKKCLAMAKNCSDVAAEGVVNYRYPTSPHPPKMKGTKPRMRETYEKEEEGIETTGKKWRRKNGGEKRNN